MKYWTVHESGKYFTEYHLVVNDRMCNFKRIFEFRTENGVFYTFKDSTKGIRYSSLTKNQLHEILKRYRLPQLGQVKE
ncbi:MAG: hypothetical protein ACPL3B_05900 [Fervidobacterium sp.]